MAAGSVQQTSRLLSMPVEIYGMVQDELLAGTRIISREDILQNDPHLDGSKFDYRADILRPLMHTCRALREAYISSYYEHVEVCIVRTGRVWYKQLAERLERTAHVLMHPLMKELAGKVRVFTVCLTRCNDKILIPLFASLLQSLPNLHTLQVMHAHSQMTTALKNGFDRKSCPQIRTIILPSCAHNILRSCPEVRSVTCNGGSGSELLGAMKKACPHVELIAGIGIDSLDRFKKSVPKLREITLDPHSLAQLTGQSIVAFPDLSVIRLMIRIFAFSCDEALRMFETSLSAAEGNDGEVTKARDLLKRTPAQSPKLLEVIWEANIRNFDKGSKELLEKKTFVI